MAAGDVDTDAVQRGIAWLVANQDDDGLWGQELYTGGGFPRVHLRYLAIPSISRCGRWRGITQPAPIEHRPRHRRDVAK
jgi:squalene cyclase